MKALKVQSYFLSLIYTFLCISGLRQANLFSNNYLARLDSELRQIWYMGVTDYFLIQRELVEFMKHKDIHFVKAIWLKVLFVCIITKF